MSHLVVETLSHPVGLVIHYADGRMTFRIGIAVTARPVVLSTPYDVDKLNGAKPIEPVHLLHQIVMTFMGILLSDFNLDFICMVPSANSLSKA